MTIQQLPLPRSDDNEEWRPVVGYEGIYEVSDQGQVRTVGRIVPQIDRYGNPSTPFVRGRLLKPYRTTMKYFAVKLNNGGGNRIGYLVHRLVMEAFVGSRPDRCECRHLDGDPENNRLENLAWGTRSENVNDAIKHGTFKRNLKGATGEQHGQAKLSATQVREIREEYELLGKRWGAQKLLARKHDIAASVISVIVRGKAWTSVT